MTSTNQHGRIRTAKVEPFFNQKGNSEKGAQFVKAGPFLALGACCFSLFEALT